MKRILITGASGFVGEYLAQHLLSFYHYEVYGTYLSEEGLAKSSVRETIRFIKVDLKDSNQVAMLIRQVKPDFIFHLAAQASAGESFKYPLRTFHDNIDPEIYLFESLRSEALFETRILIVSSAEVYGQVTTSDLPVNEKTFLRPANPYAVSKIAQDYLGLQYHLSYAFPVIRVRPFNHIGPGQKAGYVVADFAKQIAEIEKGMTPPIIKVGNLEARRDFTDVRDIVKTYPLILQKGIPGEVYNVGSGISHRIQAILDILLSMSTTKITVEIDQSKLRPSDIPETVCDNTKIKSIIDWNPEIPLEQTLQDILEYWRKQ